MPFGLPSFLFSAALFPGVAKELLAARHFFKKGGLTVLLLYGL